MKTVKRTEKGFLCRCCKTFVKYLDKNKGTNYGDLCADCYYLPSSCKIGKCRKR